MDRKERETRRLLRIARARIPSGHSSDPVIQASRERRRREQAAAWETLLQQNLGCLIRHARSIANSRRMTDEEVMSFAYEGFVKAVRKFDFNNGAKFITYLWRAARQNVCKARRGGPVHVPIGAADRDAADRAFSWQSLHVQGKVRDEFVTQVRDKSAPDGEAILHRQEKLQIIRASFGVLTEREQEVLERRCAGERLYRLAADMGVSKERIRQIELAAIRKLKEVIGSSREEVDPV